MNESGNLFTFLCDLQARACASYLVVSVSVLTYESRWTLSSRRRASSAYFLSYFKIIYCSIVGFAMQWDAYSLISLMHIVSVRWSCWNWPTISGHHGNSRSLISNSRQVSRKSSFSCGNKLWSKVGNKWCSVWWPNNVRLRNVFDFISLRSMTAFIWKIPKSIDFLTNWIVDESCLIKLCILTAIHHLRDRL